MRLHRSAWTRRVIRSSNIGFKTLRPRNSEIRGAGLYAEIDNWLDESGSSAYIDSAAHNRSNELLSLNYLLLLPTLAARLERVLVYFLLGRGLIHHKQLTIGVLERDLTCIEIGWLGFVDRLTRLATLYGIHISIPEVFSRLSEIRVTGTKVKQPGA